MSTLLSGLGYWAVFLGIFSLLDGFRLVDFRHLGFCLQIDRQDTVFALRWVLTEYREFG
jgi:hypothetical protein